MIRVYDKAKNLLQNRKEKTKSKSSREKNKSIKAIDIEKYPPVFSTYKPDIKNIKLIAEKYSHYKNIVVIGYGGSINNFKAMYYSLYYKINKNVFTVNTVEPEFLDDISKKTKPDNTVVVAISKSGNTISVIEDLIFFLNKGYKSIVCLTGGGSLLEIARRMNFDIVPHPDISGRFSGITECALFPAILCGININNIIRGAQNIYKITREKNNFILKISRELYEFEKLNYTEIFMPVYSQRLHGFSLLITQLIHETTGKNKKGQTVISAVGPESQHETNQRFFGGRKNMIGFFINIKKHKDMKLRVSKKLENISIKNSRLKILNKLNLSNSINYELGGVVGNCDKDKIPYFILEVDNLNEEAVGEIMAFWQYLAYYSALLRKQNPFNQPEVELSKNITFDIIKNSRK